MADTHLQLNGYYTTTKGLRAVPYLVLIESVVDEASALYLSHIITHHNEPHVLGTRVPSAKAGQSAQQLATYDASSECKGIIYVPHGTLESLAVRVLALAEKLRFQFVENGREQSTSDVCNETSVRNSGESDMCSSQSMHGPSQESLLHDFDRARNRIQTKCLETCGPAFNDMWIAALRMMLLSRLIQPQKPAHHAKTTTQDKQRALSTPKPKQLLVKSIEVPTSLVTTKPNPWGTALTPKSTNSPLSMRQRPDKPRKKDSHGSAAKMCNSLPVKTMHNLSVDREYRSTLPCGFTAGTWSRILAYAAETDGLLSPSQQRSVFRYGSDRRTLKKEQDHLGLKRASQIWHCLDQMDCLTYAMR